MQRRVHGAFAVVHREVTRLLDGGVLLERAVGRARLVRATDYPLLRPLTEMVQAGYGPVPVLTELLRGQRGVREAYIFGDRTAYHGLSVVDGRLPQVILTSGFPPTVDCSDILLNMTTTVTFSALLRTPNEVIERLEQGDVLLTRRDAEPLRLSKARSAQAESNTLSALAQLIAASLDDDACDRLVSRLADPFPWIALLPSKFQREFVDGFLGTARACASVGRFDRLTIVLSAWQATAEAYADPHLTPDGSDLERLSRPAAVANPRTNG